MANFLLGVVKDATLGALQQDVMSDIGAGNSGSNNDIMSKLFAKPEVQMTNQQGASPSKATPFSFKSLFGGGIN